MMIRVDVGPGQIYLKARRQPGSLIGFVPSDTDRSFRAAGKVPHRIGFKASANDMLDTDSSPWLSPVMRVLSKSKNAATRRLFFFSGFRFKSMAVNDKTKRGKNQSI